MNNTVIKKASILDLTQLQLISRKTFSESFSASTAPEHMKKYLEEGFSSEKLASELEDENSQFYFAALNTEIVGYLKLNFGLSQTDIKEDNAVEIERIYVLSAYQDKKIGQLLYEKAMQVAAQKGLDYIWLGVWEENHKAIRFYERNGFTAFDKHIFRLGDDEQTDIMMKRIL